MKHHSLQIIGIIFCLFGPVVLFSQQDTMVLYFQTGKYHLTKAQKEELRAKEENLYPEQIYEIHIIGSTDMVGSEEFNYRLSQKRATSVYQFIQAAYEVDLDTLYFEGIGFSEAQEEGDTIKEDARFRKATVIFSPVYKPVISKSLEELDSLKAGSTLVIDSLIFIPNEPQLMLFAIPKLHKLLSILKENPNLRIEIQGHVHGRTGILTEETLVFYDELSWARAKNIHDFLVSSGINEDRLQYKGFGATRPLPDYITDRGLNRRVEILVLKEQTVN